MHSLKGQDISSLRTINASNPQLLAYMSLESPEKCLCNRAPSVLQNPMDNLLEKVTGIIEP